MEKILLIALGLTGLAAAIDIHDFCPHNHGVFYDFEEGWHAINVTLEPKNDINGPEHGKPGFENFGGINLQEVFSNLDKTRKHCMICYNYASQKMKMSTRLLGIPKGCTLAQAGKRKCKDFEVFKEQRKVHLKKKIQIFSTAIDPSTGESVDYDCNMLAYEVVAVTKGTATMQCWLKPLPTVEELKKLVGA